MQKKIIAISGSPRKGKNTEQLLQEALRGAAEAGAETKLIRLYELKFHGCYSCFACKRLGSPAFGRCVHGDDLQAVLKEIHEEADGLIMGAPIYWGHPSAEMQAFQERLLFQYYDYSPEGKTLLNRVLPVLCIYTMNATAEQTAAYHMDAGWNMTAATCKRFFGSYQELRSYDTLQFNDYSKYASSMFDEAHKKDVHEREFPEDMAKAYELGRNLLTE